MLYSFWSLIFHFILWHFFLNTGYIIFCVNSLVFFFFFKLIYLFIFFWLCWVFVSVLGLSLAAASGGHSSSRCTGLSPSRPLSLRSTSSRRAGPAVVAHGPSRSAACGILPDQGSNPRPLHWQADSQPLCHQGSPLPSLNTTKSSVLPWLYFYCLEYDTLIEPVILQSLCECKNTERMKNK